MGNAIRIIAPYRYEGMWVFDDDTVDLVREPFVSGADTMIDWLVRDLPGAENGFVLVFSDKPFPGYQVKIVWVRGEMDGNWYRLDDPEMEGWLCPALLKYFPDPPGEIYIQAKPRP